MRGRRVFGIAVAVGRGRRRVEMGREWGREWVDRWWGGCGVYISHRRFGFL